MTSWLQLCLLAALMKPGFAVLPQVSQEGLLRPYRSYADVTLFHYYVPREVSLATFEFAAFMDSPSCSPRNVYVYLQHGSYPVMAPDNSSFPPSMNTERTSMFTITLLSYYQPHNATVFKVYNPLPGSWFAAGYLPDWDQHVQQQGLGHKCQYSLGSVALWTQVTNIESLQTQMTTRSRSLERYSYYRFYIPTSTWKFKLSISGCQFSTSRRPMLEMSDNETQNTSSCIDAVYVEARSLPNISLRGTLKTVSPLTDEANSAYEEDFPLPYTDSYYYVLVVSQTKVSYNITVTMQDCPIQILGKSFIQRFADLALANADSKDQALRMNFTHLKPLPISSDKNCSCVPIFRLTRIKHSQDFSDTFLLESRDWFTTWLALIDNSPVGVTFELLPYVDIGGTLSVSIHLDDMLVKPLAHTLVVFACIRKARPPNTFCCEDTTNGSDCCEAGMFLEVSSKSLATLDATVLIPFPEPDNWFISFVGKCYLDGVQVPCTISQILVSIDIRTQPCVLSKPQTPGGPILPCGNYGVCQEVHKGQFFYTTCRCIGGYRGWDCSDDSHAIPSNLLLMATLLLTLSNAFFIPAIFLALRRRMFTQAVVYLSTMIASTLYHACDQDIYGYCLTRFSVLQFCDFFSSILAFWVTLIALARCPPKYDSVLYIIGAIVIAVGVEYNRTGLLVFVVPFALGIGIPLCVWTYRCVRAKRWIRPDIWTVILFLPGVCLGGAGLILYAFVETEDNYSVTHSAWHVIIALSLLYLLPKRVRKSSGTSTSTDTNSDGQLTVSNSAELAISDPGGASPTEQNPIFFVTSELDHLVQTDGTTGPRVS